MGTINFVIRNRDLFVDLNDEDIVIDVYLRDDSRLIEYIDSDGTSLYEAVSHIDYNDPIGCALYAKLMDRGLAYDENLSYSDLVGIAVVMDDLVLIETLMSYPLFYDEDVYRRVTSTASMDIVRYVYYHMPSDHKYIFIMGMNISNPTRMANIANTFIGDTDAIIYIGIYAIEHNDLYMLYVLRIAGLVDPILLVTEYMKHSNELIPMSICTALDTEYSLPIGSINPIRIGQDVYGDDLVSMVTTAIYREGTYTLDAMIKYARDANNNYIVATLTK